MKRLLLLCCMLAVCCVQAFAAGNVSGQNVAPDKQAIFRREAERKMRAAELYAQIAEAKSHGSVPEALYNEYMLLLAEAGRVNDGATLDQGGESWADAVDLDSNLGSGVESGTTVEANDDVPHVTEPPCYQGTHYNDGATAPDVVYRWTAPYTSTYTFSLCGSSYDTELSLWRNNDPNAPVYPEDYICGNDDSECSGETTLQSTVTCIGLEAGQSIYIVVDGWSNLSGQYVLSIFDCNGSCAETGLAAPGTLTSTTCAAGRECDLFSSEDKVVAVQIPYAGHWTVTCSITDVNFDPYIFIGYECCTADICIDDDGAGYPNSRCECLELGQGTIYVTVEGLGGCGEFVLDVQPCPTGRCCYSSAAGPGCSTTSESECQQLLGIWEQGTSCEEAPCETGRCCYFDDGESACVSGLDEPTCLYLLGGEWTPGLTCDDACPAPGDCGPIDLVFAVDITGSMFGALANVAAELPNIIALANSSSAGDLRLGLVTFDDLVYSIHDLTFNTAAVQASIAALVASGGANLPEASDEALREIITMDGQCVASDFTSPFRPTAAKIIVLITDAAPGGCDDTYDASDLVNAHQRALDAAGLGIRISSVYVPTPGNAGPAVVLPALSDYALTSAGSLRTVSPNGTGTGGAINQIISDCGQGELRLSSLGTDLRCDPNGGGITTPDFTIAVDVFNDGTAECMNAVLELTNVGGDAGTAIVTSANPVALGNIAIGQTISPTFDISLTPDADGGNLILTVTVTSDNCPPNFLDIVIEVPDCDSCDGDREIYIYEDQHRLPPGCQCAYLCAGQIVDIFVCGTGLTPGDYPVLHITPGCMTDDCSEDCEPAQFLFSETGWTLWGDSCWHNLLIPGTDGCVCICFERYLPVELASFGAVPRDGEIQLNWTTASETDNDRFELRRDGVLTAQVAATNSASGSTYSFVDGGLVNGRIYHYELVSVTLDGVREVIGEVESAPRAGAEVVTELALNQNYPNPFNPETSISFDLVDAGTVKLSVFNAVGQEVATLVNGSLGAGRHEVTFNAAGLPSGLYFYRLIAGESVLQKKMLLLK